MTVAGGGGGRVRECGSCTRADKMWSGRWPGLEKGERRVWGHHDTRVVGAERQIKKKVQMRGNGEGVKGTCWAPAPGVGGYKEYYLTKFNRQKTLLSWVTYLATCGTHGFI